MKEAQSVSNFAPGMQPEYMQRESGWTSWVEFAGLMLILVGAFHVVQGLVALFRDEVFVVTQSRLVLNLDYTGWGWIHLVMGVILVLAGVGLFSGRMIARIVGVAVAFLSALVNIAFLPAYPIWSVMMITIDVLVIWAITVHGGELRRPQPVP
ncbi:MAG: DUF7144 family membrane protein [Marmoricola sp.]